VATVEEKQEIRRSARAAAIRAKKRIQKDAERRAAPLKKTVTESSDEEEVVAVPRKRGFLGKAKPKTRIVEEEEEEEEEDEDEDEDEDEYDDEDDEEEEEGAGSNRGGLIISFGGGGEEPADWTTPKRHNMKKESESVKKFVELITQPFEEGGIDDQIDEFKRLTAEKQTELLVTLDRKSTADSNKQSMMFKILSMKLSPDTQKDVLAKYNSLQSLDPGTGEYYKQRAWLEKFASLPLGVYKDIPVKLSDGPETCSAFMEKARRCLGESIYGQEEAKIQILQFIASKITNPSARGLSLLLAGPPGIGKTSLIKNGIAKALEWPVQFISLGGDSDASTYTGHQLVYEGSHSGKIANCLAQAKSMSTILMFDELDKISATPKGEEVQNMLIHLTDPASNEGFEDKYLSGIPIDLSKAMFIFSANDISKIDKVLLDRLMVIELKGYDLKQKITIAENYLLPAALKDVSLVERVAISKEVLTYIIEEYAKEETGVRELKRCVEQVAQKLNMLRMYNAKELPFHIKDFALPFVVKKEHIDLFLKKKEDKHAPPPNMYM
jgi:ATP-dependent Lon protease